MKDKLELNMYVRTKGGYISQYKYYNTTNMGKLLCIPLSNGTFANVEDIVKASYNIIDLIEVGDYVNGRLVYKNDEENYLYLIGFDADGNFYEDSLKEIKSIVTKEQMEQMAYKVGD